jgi:hypothetical protein
MEESVKVCRENQREGGGKRGEGWQTKGAARPRVDAFCGLALQVTPSPQRRMLNKYGSDKHSRLQW